MFASKTQRLIATSLFLVLTLLPVGQYGFGVAHIQYAEAGITNKIIDLLPIKPEELLPEGLLSATSTEDIEKLRDSFEAGVVACAVMTVIMMIIDQGSFKVPVSVFTQEIKETFLDCVMYNVVNVLIEDMLRSLTRWVQGGFNGNPQFTTRINGSLHDLADQIANDFAQSATPFLCSPFRDLIQRQLISSYQRASGMGWRDGTICTLVDIAGNDLGAFAQQNFEEGGWDGWIEFFDNPYNNPIGSYLELTDELASRVGSAAQEQEKKIDLGRGFLSREVQTCYIYPSDGMGPPQTFELKQGETVAEAKARLGITSTGDIECDDPETVTPGSYVEKAISKQYDIPMERLTMSDELNELIQAVIYQLVKGLLTDDKGLAGYDVDSVENLEPNTLGFDLERPAVHMQSCPGTGWYIKSTVTDEQAGETLEATMNETFTASLGEPNRTVQFTGVGKDKKYTKLTYSLDFKPADPDGDGSVWYAGKPDGLHQIIWVQRGQNVNNFQWKENNLSTVAINGPSENEVKTGNNLNIDIAYCLRNKRPRYEPDAFQAERWYRLEYEYDTRCGELGCVETKIRDLDTGRVVMSAYDNQTADMIQSNHPYSSKGGAGFFLNMGSVATYDPEVPEVPVIGWQFKNLSATIEYEPE